MAVRVYNVASLPRTTGYERPSPSSREVSGPSWAPTPFTVCICNPSSRSKPATPGQPQQQTPGCTWPRCVLPYFDTRSNDSSYNSSSSGRAIHSQAVARIQTVSEFQGQLPYTKTSVATDAQQNYQENVSYYAQQQQQQQRAFLQQQQQQQHWIQEPYIEQQSLQQDMQQQANSKQPTVCQLMQAISSTVEYQQLANLVHQQSSCFQAHHTAAALLQLAYIVTGHTAPQHAAAAVAEVADVDSASMDYDQEWTNPPLRSLDGMASYSAGAASSRDELCTSATVADSFRTLHASSWNSSSSSSSRGILFDSSNRLETSYCSSNIVNSVSSNGYAGLAGLISSPGDVSSTSALAPAAAAAENGSSGFLSGATMAARMARARQQHLEQQQLLRQQRWGAEPWTNDQGFKDSSSSSSMSVAPADAINRAADGSAVDQHWQQQQQQGQQEQQQQIVHYDKLLRHLLMMVQSQAGRMSASSGLTVLKALVLLRHQPDKQLVKRLLTKPFKTGLRKLRPAGLVATGVRLAQLQISPTDGWCRSYFSAVQHHVASLSGQQLAAAVQSLGRLGWRDWPEGWGSLVAARLGPELGKMSAELLLHSAQALGYCGYIANESWTESFLASSRQHLASMDPQSLIQLLSSLQQLQITPTDAWLRSFFTACPARNLRSLNPSHWPVLLSAIAGLKIRPDGSWLRDMYAACAPSLNHMEPQQIADTAAAAAAVGMSPPEPWVAALAAASMWKLACCSPAQLAAVAEALAALKAHPGDVWLQQYAAATDAAMLYCDGEELARLVAAAAALKHAPATGWLQRVEAASHNQLGALSPSGLSSLARAMQQLAAQPSLSWVYAFVSAAYPQLDQFNGQELSGMFDALPALAPGAGSTDLLVQICCQELPARQQERLKLQQQQREAKFKRQSEQQQQRGMHRQGGRIGDKHQPGWRVGRRKSRNRKGRGGVVKA